jgi:hypothetical protein
MTSEVLRYACVVRHLRDGVCEFRRAFFSATYDGAQRAARDSVRAYETTGATAVVKTAGGSSCSTPGSGGAGEGTAARSAPRRRAPCCCRCYPARGTSGRGHRGVRPSCPWLAVITWRDQVNYLKIPARNRGVPRD